jgi:hypothetical protein
VDNVIKEFCTWLASRVPGLTLGGNLQVGFREQDAPVRCHVVVETGGLADFDLPYRQNVMLQIVTRGPKGAYQQTREDAFAIYDSIHGTSGWTLGPLVSGGATYKVWSIGAMAMPQYIGGDSKGNHEWTCNFQCQASKL